MAVVDGGIDPLITELRWAKDIKGRDISKIVDFYAVAEPGYAPIQGRVIAGLSTRSERKVMLTKSERQGNIDLFVPQGTGQLVINARALGGRGDVDIYLFDMTGKEPDLKVRSSRRGDETVVVDRPAAGNWRVVLDLASDEDAVEIAYDDELVIQHTAHQFYNVAQASFDVDDRIKRRGVGESWKAAMLPDTGDLGWVPRGRTPAVQWIAIDPSIGPDTDPATLGRLTIPFARE